MVGTPGYTTGEIREYVHEYYVQPYGAKAAWLKAQPFTRHQLRRWQQVVFEGDLDRNLVPREHGGMSFPQSARAAFERARANETTEHQAEIERLSARVRELEGTNDALGKAIGLLHEMSEREPEQSATDAEPSS